MSLLAQRPALLAVLAILLLVLTLLAISSRMTSAAPAQVDATSCGTTAVPNTFCSFDNPAVDNDVVIGPNSCNVVASCLGLADGVQINAGGSTLDTGSCNGTNACANLGANASIGGDSCTANNACDHTDATGITFNVGTGSCNEGFACTHNDASGITFSVGNASCVGSTACDHQGGADSSFSAGDDSCRGSSACDHGGGSGNTFSAGNGSCVGNRACDHFLFENSSFSIENFSCNTTFENAATADCRSDDAEIGTCVLNDTTHVACVADVSADVNCPLEEVAAGADFTCDIVVENSTAVLVAGATMSTATPPNTTLASLTVPTGWTCGPLPAVGGTGAIACAADGNLDPSTSHLFELTLNVNPATAATTVITLEASVGATGDSNAGNNAASDTVTVVEALEEPDVSAALTCTPEEVEPGSSFACDIDVTNETSVAVAGATLSTATPPSTTFGGLTVPTGWTCGTQPAVDGTGAIECTADADLDASSTHSFLLTLSVDAGTPDATAITVEAGASATDDANAGNNDASDTVTVAVAAGEPVVPDVSVGLTCTPEEVEPGDGLVCVIVVRNLSSVPVLGATMTTSTPANTTFVSLTIPAGWTCETPAAGEAGTIACDPDLDPDSIHTFVLVLNVNENTLAGAQIAVAARVDAEEDTDPANSTVVEIIRVVADGDGDDEGPGATPTPVIIICCPVDLEVDLDNTNSNVIGIDNDNANDNTNTNGNDNANGNLNANENASDNANEQDQGNGQDQGNANGQSNDVTSSPQVNIDFGR